MEWAKNWDFIAQKLQITAIDGSLMTWDNRRNQQECCKKEKPNTEKTKKCLKEVKIWRVAMLNTESFFYI